MRGKVIAQKEYDLEFPFSGIVESIYVKEGQYVNAGDSLMKLDTKDLELEIRKIKAQISQAEANLAAQKAKLLELKKGPRLEEVELQKAKIESVKIALESAKKTLMDVFYDAYTKSDDSIRTGIDELFNELTSLNPELKFFVNDFQLKLDIERQRLFLESVLRSWKSSLDQLTIESDFDSYIVEAKNNLNQIKEFLNKLTLAVNAIVTSPEIPQSLIDRWKSNVATARVNINTAILNLTSAEEKFRIAQSNLRLAEQELKLIQSGATQEQISAQESQVEQAEANIKSYQAQLDLLQEKIRKSILYTPQLSKVVKIWLEEGELFKLGQPAISLVTFDYKIQADISELDIGKIKEGSEVVIKFDAFPNREIKGKIAFIEPKEIIS